MRRLVGAANTPLNHARAGSVRVTVPLDAEPKQTLRHDVRENARTLSASRRDIRNRLQVMFGWQKPPSAIQACLLYLQLFVGESVPTKELEIVSGINEYARRIRELRVEQGYDIVSANAKGIGWAYTLRSPIPDPVVASRWQTLNDIRRMKGSGQDRILSAFKALVGQPLSTKQLTYVSKINTARERARDLRLQDGWRIFGRHTGRPDLKVTEYVLESLEQLPPHDRKIRDEVYESVLRRDHYCCRKLGCGWSRSERVPGSRKQFLEVHHRIMHAQGGTNDVDNLVTLCNMDHDEVHRSNLQGDTFDAWLQGS